MRYLLDTGILLRLLDRSDPLHALARQSVRNLAAHPLFTATQNIAEFWNVCTRPSTARGGLGIHHQETSRRLRLLERFLIVLREPPSAYTRWKSIILSCKVSGRQVHDARLAALMQAYRIKRILTFNDGDFTRYPSIIPIHPQQLVNAPSRP